jgi:hypothetical protein
MLGPNPHEADHAPTGRRIEPTSLTISDLIAIVAGVAIAIAAWPPFSVPPMMPGSIPYWFVIGLILYWCVLALETGASLGVLARQALYRRRARPAEWLGMLIALELVTLPSLDGAVNACFSHQMILSAFGMCRWILAGAALLAICTVLALLAFLGRLLPCWTRTIALAVLALLFLWGPAQVLAQEIHSLLPRLSRFRPEWLFWIVVESRRALGEIPMGLIYGIPVAAIVRDWRTQRERIWLWTEKAAVGVGLAIGLGALGLFYFGRSEWPPDGLRAERIVMPFWLLAVWGLSRWLISRFGPWWNRCLAGESGATA